jgi:formylglycine-generating enzyme
MWPEAHQDRAPVEDWPPAWANAWGDDEYGVWAEFEIRSVVQRMRWIEPGSFLMGAPNTESERNEDEGPQHLVQLSHGFWLADTPCTQALWLAVVGGKNPSYFANAKGWEARPVEQVNVEDVSGFLKDLRGLVPTEAQPSLPSEAQWEYACRAGTRTAYWWGDSFDKTKANARGNHQNTTPVKMHRPNPWGLHDMHGNVWEWCADGELRAYTKAARVDPVGPSGVATRVVRGGSWGSPTANARAAYRDAGHPGHRYRYQGFRFALRSTGPGGAAVD